jgi:hypothetical protein
MVGKNTVHMKRRYLITLEGSLESECSQTIKDLDPEQYDLVSGIISELWCGSNSTSAPFLTISEIPIRVIDKVRVLSRGNILVCSDADCLEVNQFVKADFSDTVFQVSALEHLPHVPSVGVVLRPNDQVLDIPLGAVLEVLS